MTFFICWLRTKQYDIFILTKFIDEIGNIGLRFKLFSIRYLK